MGKTIVALLSILSIQLFAAMPDKAYIVDYWAPPVDMVPAVPIADYNPSVRIPEYFWLKYDGAYSLALRLRPIPLEKIENEIAVGLIDTNRNKSALAFCADIENQAKFRRVGIYNLDLDATEFSALSFKVRSKVKDAGDALTVRLSGRGVAVVLDSAKAPKTLQKEEAKDGFVGYTLPLKANHGARISTIEFELPVATSADFEQTFEVIDLHLKRPVPKARFEDLPPRIWVKKMDLTSIDDIFAYARGSGASDTIAALPKAYELRPQLEKEKDGGFKVEGVTVRIGGKNLPAVKITLEKGPRCLLRFPLVFDGLEYNTMTFAGKVEVFEGAKPCLGDVKPMLWGANQKTLNGPFDTFQVSFFSKTDDFCDWTRWGIAQADFCQNKQLDCAVSNGGDGWRAFAYDIAHSDPSNNKSSFYTRLTHWCLFYDNSKIPEGKKVVVTIADPRLTKGVMLSGGDLGKYKAFIEGHDMSRIVDFDAMKTALEPPSRCRLANPIRLVENRIPIGKIYQLPAEFPRTASREEKEVYTQIVTDAVNEFRDVLARKCGMAEEIPVEKSLPKTFSNAIVVGGNAYAMVNKSQYDDDMKIMKGKPGCAIRSDGSNVYVYASSDYNYAGNVRGLAFGLYELLENNTDLIYSHRARAGRRGPSWPNRIFKTEATGTFDLLWGDRFVHVPPVPESSMSGVGGPNRIAGYNWVGDWQFGRHRTRSVNHWWGYGTEPRGKEEKGKPNETWGLNAEGRPMVPGCYSGHPCLIRVLDRARESYLRASGFASLSHNRDFARTQAPGKAFAWNSYDVHGLWVEDSISMCQCGECRTPIRLADGSTVGPDSPYFRSTQFYSNGSAMINAVNVYANRRSRVESIAYFWMAPVPLMTVSRNYDIRFCPYIRKNYFVPIFAPMNDMHWRAITAWSQQDVRLAIYEYFLDVGARPWADVVVYDIREELGLHCVYDWMAEAEDGVLARMEKWVMERLLWGAQGDDVPTLRAYYLKRTYREAAESIGRFYELVMSCSEKGLTFASPMDFENNQIIVRNAMRTKAKGLFAGTVAEEMEKCVVDAERRVKDSLAAKEVKDFRAAWDKYKSDALASEAEWRADLMGSTDLKPIAIVEAMKDERGK